VFSFPGNGAFSQIVFFCLSVFTVVWRAIYGAHSFFKPAHWTDFSQFSSISPGNFSNWVVFVFLSFISDPFSRSFGELNTQKSPFSQIFHHFHTDNTHILSEKILIGKKTSAAGETTVSSLNIFSFYFWMLFNGSSDNYSYYHTPKRATSPSREKKERSSSSEPSSNEKEQVMNDFQLFILLILLSFP
jgi:hypothetical protein